MEIIRKQKWPILAAVLVVVLVLGVNLVLNAMAMSGSAGRCVTLGQQYLNDLDYNAAILQFTNAIQLDPTNKPARIGLSEAYTGLKEYDLAEKVLKDSINENNPDAELSEALLKVYDASDNLPAKIELLDSLIAHTDDEKYFTMKEETLAALYGAPRSVASGDYHYIRIRNGQVETMGNNSLGQLGTDVSLGDKEAYQENYASAGFRGDPLQVYATGNASYVLDKNGNLWGAGENRSGQMNTQYGAIVPESGWVQVTNTGDVVAAAPVPGLLYIVRKDGSLWCAGTEVGQTLQPVSSVSGVVDIQSYDGYIYVLTASGDLYTITSYQYSNAGYYMYKQNENVRSMNISSSGLTLVFNNGDLNYNGYFSTPDDWSYDYYGVNPNGYQVVQAATNGSILLLLDTDGELHQLTSEGRTKSVPVNSDVVALYQNGGDVVLELKDGTVQIYKQGETDPTSMD